MMQSELLENTLKRLLRRIDIYERGYRYLNKSRIGESFNVLLNVMQHDGEVKIDLDSISAEDAEKIVQLLNEALE